MQSHSGQTAKEFLNSMGIKIVTSGRSTDPKSRSVCKEELVIAIGNDDVQTVKELIDSGKVCNCLVGDSDISSLMIARSKEMADILIKAGADPDYKDHKGMTVLHHMLHSDKPEEIILLLIESGADVNAVASGLNMETPLLAARQLFFEGGNPDKGEQIIRRLHKAGASLDAQDDLGYTVLISAALNNKIRLARFMLSMGADPHIRTTDGKTALDWARELHHIEIERVLLDHGA
jgi:ankyrin repeat protein